MKKFVGGLAAVLAIFILAIGGYSKKPLVFSAPGPDIINFPEASVEYLERIILKEGGEYQKGEKIFVDRVDYYIEIDDNDSVAIYEKFEALKGEKSRRVEVKLTQAVIHFALASRPREIAGRPDFTATVMARHPVRMMEATRLMVSGLAERLILLENGEILREEICGWSQTRGEHPQVLPREQMRLVMRIVNKMTADFLKDGTAYLEFASALEASRAVQRYLEARFDCSSSGSPAEDLEYGQAFIDYLLD